MPSNAASLHARDLTVSFGRTTILDRVDLDVTPGRRIGLVGPNGVGKSTLLRALAGLQRRERGTITLAPPSSLVGYLPQEPERRADESVRALLERRTGVSAAAVELDAATAGLAAGEAGSDDRYAIALDRWLGLGGADLDARIGTVWDELGLAERLLDQPTASFSGGEAARASLAVLLLSRFDVYLLDEPTNDLDLDGLARLERWVTGLAAGVVVVSHDRAFMARTVTHVAELDEFSHQLSLFGGGWVAYLEERERARLQARQRFEEYDDKRSALLGRAQREREWASQGLSKVKKSDEPDKNIRAFKINQTEQLAGRAARTERALERLEVVEEPREPWELRLTIAEAPRSGAIVARLDRAEVERGSFRLGPLDLMIGFGERVAIVGPNGSGKTTLIDLIVGRTAPTSGERYLGPGVVVGEIEQVRHQLVGERTLVDSFMRATGMTVSDARTLLAKFGLGASDVERRAGSLSPGERTRATLALLMANGTNCLVLDEPTNHLDLPAIEQLEQALDTFGGTVLLVTHDRALLEHVRLTRTIRLAGGRVAADETV
jgi:ATPase subunit of ABC transporter with duplicated ATPase domains